MTRFAAALSLALLATTAFAAEQPEQTPAQPQLADPRCTEEGLKRLMDDHARTTGQPVHGVQIIAQNNGQPPLVLFNRLNGTDTARVFIDQNVLCETPARPPVREHGVQLNASM
jgi:hypothetical protein